MNPFQMISMLQSNPIQFLAQRGINVPQNMASDPNAIIKHLIDNGRCTQQQYDNAVNMARQMGFRK
jgi:hypothetical protein